MKQAKRKPAQKSETTSRDGKGRFAKGNRGGPGNPFAGKMAKFRAAVMRVVSEEDVEEIVEAIVLKAKEGDLAAARLVLSYVVGKPGAMPAEEEEQTEAETEAAVEGSEEQVESKEKMAPMTPFVDGPPWPWERAEPMGDGERAELEQRVQDAIVVTRKLAEEAGVLLGAAPASVEEMEAELGRPFGDGELREVQDLRLRAVWQEANGKLGPVC